MAPKKRPVESHDIGKMFSKMSKTANSASAAATPKDSLSNASDASNEKFGEITKTPTSASAYADSKDAVIKASDFSDESSSKINKTSTLASTSAFAPAAPKAAVLNASNTQMAALDAAVELTGQPPSVVLPLLESCQWNADIAITVYFEHIAKRAEPTQASLQV